jgi:hypothetical protein
MSVRICDFLQILRNPWALGDWSERDRLFLSTGLLAGMPAAPELAMADEPDNPAEFLFSNLLEISPISRISEE